MERESKRKLSFQHPGSGYSSQWERAHETLTNLKEIVSDLTYLYEELDEEYEQIPSACTTEHDIAQNDLKHLYTAIDSLKQFTKRHQDFLNGSIALAVKCYGQTAPEWY